MRETAKTPNDLELLFVERANAGDVEGLVELYEPGASLDSGDGELITGHDQLRKFFTDYLAGAPRFAPSEQSPAIRNGDLALTSSRLENGDITGEIARRQADGSWLWVIDRFVLGNESRGL